MKLSRTLVAAFFVVSTASALADGMVVPERFSPKVQIPNQQALIHFSGGVERLVIETSFLGEGTNFAWVVPLPSAPEVRPVSEDFFAGLQEAFRPELVHRVLPYYAGVLFVCGMAFLGWRSLKEETSWIADLPLCVLLAAGAGLLGKHTAFGLVAGILLLCIRMFTRSPATFAMLLLFGMAFATCLVVIPNADMRRYNLIETMGPDGARNEVESIAGVTVVSFQRAGVFDVTTIRGKDQGGILAWLEKNGYGAPESAGPAIRQYIEEGWVFVASKARRDPGNPGVAALHPLAFTFSVSAPVYPTRLTAVDSAGCAIDLYVFGDRSASARHFDVARSDRIDTRPKTRFNSASPGLRIPDPEILALIGNSTVGTKLSGRLTPRQMATDAVIKSNWYWRRGATVFSYSGAITISLNVALPFGAVAWAFLGLSRGGWNVNERWIWRWRWSLLAAALGLGLAVFLLLPKVEIVRHPRGLEEAAAPAPYFSLC